MQDNSNSVESLISVPDDVQASLIVDLLEDHGIKATAVGGYTAGFKAEAPGLVDVLVMNDDLEQARVVLRRFEEKQPETNRIEMIENEVEELSDECLPSSSGSGRP